MSSWVKYKFKRANLVPEAPGVFVIYSYGVDSKSHRIQYIGSSGNTKERLESLKKCRGFFNHCHFVKIKIVADDQQRLSLEQSLVGRLRPKKNVEREHIPGLIRLLYSKYFRVLPIVEYLRRHGHYTNDDKEWDIDSVEDVLRGFGKLDLCLNIARLR